MRIEHLVLFCLVIEEGSISKVARLRHVSQPAITSKIKQLEEHYGLPLFDRKSGHMRVTEAGSTLYQYAKEIITTFENSEEAVKSVHGFYETTLHIGASLTIGDYVLPAALVKFQKQHEKLQFHVTVENTPNILSKLDNHDIDIALVEGMVLEDHFKVKKFAQDELILIVPKNHRWKSRASIALHELTSENMIWREKDSGARKIIENILRKHQLLDHMQSHMEIGSTQSIKGLVETGLGVSILPKQSVEKELEMELLHHVPITDVSILRDLWLVRRDERFPKKGMVALMDFLKKLYTPTGSNR